VIHESIQCSHAVGRVPPQLLAVECSILFNSVEHHGVVSQILVFGYRNKHASCCVLGLHVNGTAVHSVRVLYFL
jgi:hypothetical protein